MLPNASDPTEYGLPLSDLDPLGVIDPETEQPASEYEAHAVDTASLTLTGWRAMARITISGGVATVADHTAMWGETTGVKPTATYNSTGDVTITWDPAGYPDLNPTPARQVTRAPQFRFGTAIAEIDTTPISIGGILVTSNTIRVKLVDMAGTPTDRNFQAFVR